MFYAIWILDVGVSGNNWSELHWTSEAFGAITYSFHQKLAFIGSYFYMVRNIIGVIVGIIVSMAVNMSLIFIGYAVIPPPAGADVNTMEGLASTIHLFEPKNFIFPFLAHALGPLVGTFVTMLIAVSSKMKIAIGMAVLFLLLGIWANVVIPAPLWYHVVDILFAYVPTTLIGAKLGGAGKEA